MGGEGVVGKEVGLLVGLSRGGGSWSLGEQLTLQHSTKLLFVFFVVVVVF